MLHVLFPSYLGTVQLTSKKFHYIKLERMAVIEGFIFHIPTRLQYGCTWVNTHFMLVSEMPHGGMKLSGYGKDMSVYGLEDYTVVRHVMIKH